MANLNLSQFGENTSVSDADYTFVWDTAASISKRVSRNSWLNSGTLTSDAPVTISQTWNQIGTAFTAFKVNAVSTASAAASLLLDLQVGGVSQFRVTKGGAAYMTNLAPSGFLSFQNDSGQIYFGAGGDVQILRDAANTLALRNGAAAQTFRIYNTYTDASNHERAAFAWFGNTAFLDVGASGTGTRRDLNIGAQNVSLFSGSGPNLRWKINSSGHFIAGNDNTYDIGESGANRPRNVYVGSNIYAAGNVGIGTTSPTSKLQVSAGDVEVDTIAKGVILKSPDGTRYRVTVANGGTLSVAAV